MNEWIRKKGRIYWYDQYALNEQETAFSKYDPDRIVDELCGIGADIIALYASNQFSIAYYPSKVWPQHPNLHGRDYFGEVCSRLQARGKKVVAYINWLESRHPEWKLIPLGSDRSKALAEAPLVSWSDPSDPEKRVQNLPGGQWQTSCFNSPRRAQAVAVAREIAENYRPDGFHLDMFLNSSVCVCDHCLPELERICGTKEITRETLAAHWREFIDWRSECSASLIADVTAAVKPHGVITAHNMFAPLFLPVIWGQSEKWLPSLDVSLSECFDAFLSPCTDLNSTSVNVKWQHAVGKPSWIVRTSTQIHYAHWPISKAQWLVYAAACKANGCEVFGPCGVGAYPDTTTAKSMLENVKVGFDAFMEDADLHEGATSAAKIGLVFSWATRNRAAMDDMAWCEEFNGWARLLIEEHLPFDVVAAEHIEPEDDLSRYDLLILPNSRCLSDSFCEKLSGYVSHSGRILATAQSSLCDENGDPRADFALAGVLGVSRQGSVDGPFAIERPAEPEPASGAFQQVRASGKVISRRVEVDPAGPVSGMLDPLPAKPSEWPVAATSVYGTGSGLYVAFEPGRFYEKHGDEHIGQFMAELLDTVLPARQLTVNGPRTVEVTLWHQTKPERTIIHLANRTVAWSLPTDARQITEVIPVHDFEITLDAPYPNPKITCRHAEAASHIDGAKLTIRLPKLHAYAAVLIEP